MSWKGSSVTTRRFHPTLVLAQLWKTLGWAFSSSQFPSHIGSRSTLCEPHYKPLTKGFPSHIGSRSTHYTRPLLDSFYFKFPSHIGSRSTHLQKAVFYTVFMFPSHIGSRSTFDYFDGSIDYAKSFHPTLVLAQRYYVSLSL